MKLFQKLYQLTSWMLPQKRQRLNYKDICCYLDLKEDIEQVRKNYKTVIERLKAQTGKYKVIFLIRENQKWSYQSLYEELEKNDKFEPLVLVSILDVCHRGKDKTRNNIEETYNFFKSKGINVDYAYKDGEYVDLKNFSPDFVFYDQLWDLPAIHRPKYVSQFALTCYCSYSYELIDSREHYLTYLHRYLYRFFVDNELNLRRYASYMKGNTHNCVVTGYPKLDEYLKPQKECSVWKDKNKFKIIYAPHHSFEKNGIHFATFMKNKDYILKLAKDNPQTEWIFKPHPRLKYALLRNKLMTEEEIDKYYDEWAKIGTIYNQGDYFDIFRSSDLMITDSISFLAEYLPSKNPIIRLINSYSAKMNVLGILLNRGYYLTKTNEELQEVFNDIVINKNDPKKPERHRLINTVLNQNTSAAQNIIKQLLLFAGDIND